MKVKEIDIDRLVEEYRNGKTLAELSKLFGIKDETVRRKLLVHGVELRQCRFNSLENLLSKGEISSLINLYVVSGISENALAKKFGVGRNAIKGFFKRQGIKRRSQSESETLKWAQMTENQRKNQVKKAHAATKEILLKPETREKAAQTREKKGKFDSAYEMVFYNWLLDLGLSPIVQKAIGRYNCDFAIDSVAVEIFGGNWHWTGRHLTRLFERTDYLLNAGFHIIIIQVSYQAPLSVECAKYVASYCDLVRGNPATPCEYRVIRGASELIARAGCNFNKKSLVPSFTVTRNSFGRYESVPNYAINV